MALGSRPTSALLLLMPALLSSGCLTGHLLERSRIRESVSAYELALREEDRLLLLYRAELKDRDGASVGFTRRAVALSMVSLQAQPELHVDVFPLERLRPEELTPRASPPLPLVFAGGGPPSPEAEGGALEVEVDPATGRHRAFQLVGDDLDRPARFHSGALDRTEHAWWAYPLLPLSVAADVLLLLPELVFAAPLIFAGE